ncbi:MAG: SDR family NAD(P)-dependent oxidoreductase, partial [Acidisphaera sp.]|nr:SDR family NAD(P)-dependent oxidoreductase [Acidisphaera sp.]
TAYAASKAGVHMFSDILRTDLGRHGIRVIEILPGLTRTGFAQRRLRGDAAAAGQYYDRAAATLEPADITRAALYALDQPRDVTVAQMVVVPSGQW